MSDQSVEVEIGEPVINSRTPPEQVQPEDAKWYGSVVGFFNTAEAELEAAKGWAEDKQEEAMAAWSKTALSESLDTGVAAVKKPIDRAAASLGNWQDYLGDPKEMQKTLDALKWVMVAAAIGYGLYVFAPIIRGAGAAR